PGHLCAASGDGIRRASPRRRGRSGHDDVFRPSDACRASEDRGGRHHGLASLRGWRIVWVARIARVALGAAAATVSLTARAGSPPQAGAAELLDSQATSLMQEHRYAEACPKLAESDRIQPGTGVLLRLALCYELSGRTASAWAAFREAAGRARRA